MMARERGEAIALNGFGGGPPVRAMVAQSARRPAAPRFPSTVEDKKQQLASTSAPAAAPARVRTKFPETWIWTDLSTG